MAADPVSRGGPAIQDMLAEQINFMCTATGSFLPLVHAGKIKAFAVTVPKRIAAAPENPDCGLSGSAGLLRRRLKGTVDLGRHPRFDFCSS
jgi:tripartite-type tricarboxylate transporter receptor subunit TctC